MTVIKKTVFLTVWHTFIKLGRMRKKTLQCKRQTFEPQYSKKNSSELLQQNILYAVLQISQ